MSLKELFDQCVSEGASKNDTIMTLWRKGKLSDIPKAVRTYNELARDAGLILSYKDRVAAIEGKLAQLPSTDLMTDEVRKQLAQEYADQFTISEQTAMNHIREYARKSGVDIPVQHRVKLEDLLQFVKDREHNGRDQTIADLQTDLGYTENSAVSAYSRAARELGWIKPRNNVDIKELVSFMIGLEGQQLTDKEMAIQIAQKYDYAKSTAATFVTQLKFAQEYHTQLTGDVAQAA